MRSRPPAVTRQRRAFAIGMGLSVVIHVALLAFLRLGVPLAPDADDARTAGESADRFLAQRPMRVVRVAADAAPARTEASESDAYPEEAASQRPAEADAVPATRPSLSAGALDLRPVESTSGGLESVALVSTTGSADGASSDYNEGVAFEAASRAAKDGARREDRDRRGGRGSGIGIAIVGPGGGDCDPSGLPGGGVTLPPAIVDDFVGGFGGAQGGNGRSAPGGLIGGALGTNGRSLGGGSVLGGDRRVRIGGIRIGGR